MTIKVDQANPELEFRTPAPISKPPAPSPLPPIPDHPHAHHPPRSPPAHHRTPRDLPRRDGRPDAPGRSEEHTSELQSLMRISYAVFCLKKKKRNLYTHYPSITKTTPRVSQKTSYHPLQHE